MNELDSRYLRRISEPSPMLQVPQATLYGSHGIPLHDAAKTNVINVRINLTQFHLGVGGTPCSLEAMGIVPTRSLGRARFGSFSNLRVSFKSHYPSSAYQHPVVIRGVAPTSPAAVTQQLFQFWMRFLWKIVYVRVTSPPYKSTSFEGTCIMIAVLSIRLFCGAGGKQRGLYP